MPELQIPFNRGLRAESYQDKDPGAFEALQMFRPTPVGFSAHSIISMPSALQTAMSGASVTITHPYPQLFHGMGETLLFSKTALHSVNTSTWALAAQTVYDPGGTPVSIPNSGGPWQFSDFYSTWLAYNGHRILYKTDIGGTRQVRISGAQGNATTGCTYRGRNIWAGFDASTHWGSDWETFFEGWTDAHIEVSSGITIGGLGSNFVAWSSIGGGDTFDLLFPTTLPVVGHETYLASGHSATKPIFFDYLERNEAGFMPMPWQGTVWCVKPLGDGLMVYGDKGISFMPMHTLQNINTFGLEHIASLGIASRTAVGGTEKEHVFVDGEGELWIAVAREEPRRLGYKEYFSPCLGNHFTITYDPQQQEYHIAAYNTSESLNNCYILTKNGLYKSGEAVTSGFRLGGTMTGIYEDIGLPRAKFTTGLIDFDTRDIKTVDEVEVSIDSDGPVYMRAFYRNDKGGTFRETDWVALDANGRWTPRISCVEFKLELKVEDKADVNSAKQLSISYRLDGKRSLRQSIGLNS